MKTRVLEVEIKGVLTGMTLYVEGKKIKLPEINENHYYRKYPKVPIDDILDILCRLDGWVNMKWVFKLKIDGKTVSTHKGKFDHKGFATFNEKIKVV